MEQFDIKATHQISRLRRHSAYYVTRTYFRALFLFIIYLPIIFSAFYANTVGLFILFSGIIIFLLLIYLRLSIVNKSFLSEELFTTEINNLTIIEDDQLPSFTILIPLKNEGNVVKETFHKITNLKYPKDKVQIIILLEDKDEITKKSISELSPLPDNFEIVTIPSVSPFTKGRTLQYGLDEAKGEIITVYDAESHPEANQLLIAAHYLTNNAKFCYQAIIRVENYATNIITKFFHAEYREWFEKHLYHMSQQDIPFGLGGNSFFIKTSLLREVGGWDPFNVTEDVDLSARLMKNEIRTKLLFSLTYESCPENTNAWINQRSRWNKGLMITQLVHLKNSPSYIKKYGVKAWWLFWGRMALSSLATVFSIAIFVIFLTNTLDDQNYFLANVVVIVNLLVSYFILVYVDSLNMKYCNIKLSLYELMYGTLNYWLMNIIASISCYREYLLNPIHWNKTNHD